MVLRVYVRGFWPVTLKLNFYDYEVVIFGKCVLTLTAFFGIKLNLKNRGILSIQFYKTIDYKFRTLLGSITRPLAVFSLCMARQIL